jgi:hypothetical protein
MQIKFDADFLERHSLSKSTVHYRDMADLERLGTCSMSSSFANLQNVSITPDFASKVAPLCKVPGTATAL